MQEPDESVMGATYLAAVKLARENPQEYWEKEAEKVVWYKKWDKVFDSNKWFVGGELNICYNAVDRHVECGHGDDVAIKYDSPQTQDITYISYNELQDQVSRLATVLVQLGVNKGDRVLIYMATIPESIYATLACARIGAVHVQVFGGFPASILRERLENSEARVVITTTYGMDANEVVYYQPKVEEALLLSRHKPDKCLVHIRPGQTHLPLVPGRDVSWQDYMENAIPHPCIPMKSTDILLIMYTSGTTGLPKGLVFLCGSYTVGCAWFTRLTFNPSRQDTVWGISNMGWAVGQSIACYGALLNRMSSVLYEGNTSTTPDPSAYYRLISEHKINFTLGSPGPFRELRKVDPEGKMKRRYVLDSLRNVFLGGEVCDEVTLNWTNKMVGPTFEIYGGTEHFLITNVLPGLRKSMGQPKGSTGLPFPGCELRILRDDQTPCKPGEVGGIVLKLPLAPIVATTLFRNESLYQDLYLTKFPGYFDTHDSGFLDKDGFLHFDSRNDDEIKVLGHRIPGTLIEKMIMKHPHVVECVVLGLPDYRTGQKPVILFVLNTGTNCTPEIQQEILQLVAGHTNTNVVITEAVCVPVLPKSVNGKILRKAIRDMLLKDVFQLPYNVESKEDFSTLKEALKKTSLGHMIK